MSEPGDMKPIAESVDEVADFVKSRTRVPGTYLPALLVEAQLELAQLSDREVAKRLADLVVHASIRRGPGVTPRKLMLEMRERYAISDEAWHEKVGPELRRLLRDTGVVPMPNDEPGRYVTCGNCGRDTTGDIRWRWERADGVVEVPVCSVCYSVGQPAEPPA